MTTQELEARISGIEARADEHDRQIAYINGMITKTHDAAEVIQKMLGKLLHWYSVIGHRVDDIEGKIGSSDGGSGTA